MEDCGYSYLSKTDKWLIKDLAVDYIHIGNNDIEVKFPPQLKVICNYSTWKNNRKKQNIYPELSIDEYINEDIKGLKFLYLSGKYYIDKK